MVQFFRGAIFQESNEAGTGVVIRNFTCEVMAALSEKIAKPSSVSILESIVARRAVQFVCELDFDHSYFEGDSEIVISSLQNRDMFSSSFGHLIQDTLSFARSLRTFPSLILLDKVTLLLMP